jgi:hypothetical protein
MSKIIVVLFVAVLIFLLWQLIFGKRNYSYRGLVRNFWDRRWRKERK